MRYRLISESGEDLGMYMTAENRWQVGDTIYPGGKQQRILRIEPSVGCDAVFVIEPVRSGLV